MKINELIDINLLSGHILNGLVSMQFHPEDRFLTILNYTHKATYENAPWGDGTIDWCRGLIYDREDGDIVALPFKKFHNLNTVRMPETMYENLPWGRPYTAAEKVDGSLGIYYKWRGIEGIATRGSFTSDQALFATKWMKENIYHPFWPENATPLFEIIYPENRIVVDYEGWSGLVLLGMMDRGLGVEINWPGVQQMAHGKIRVAKDYSFLSVEDLTKVTQKNIEGFVVTFENGLKLKIKTEEYKRLHHIMTSMNPNSLWESLRAGLELPLDDSLPDNFKQWARLWTVKLHGEFNGIYQDAKRLYDRRPRAFLYEPTDRERRAACAEYVKAHVELGTSSYLAPIFFAMLDGKDPSLAIWRLIEPRGDDQTFKTPTELGPA